MNIKSYLLILCIFCFSCTKEQDPSPNKLVFPNSFFPKNTSNNRFLGKGEAVKTISLKIYDRLGQQVYYADNSHAVFIVGWDGKMICEDKKTCDVFHEGVFTWYVEGEFQDGSPLRTLDGKKSGQVIIIK